VYESAVTCLKILPMHLPNLKGRSVSARTGASQHVAARWDWVKLLVLIYLKIAVKLFLRLIMNHSMKTYT